MFVDLNTFLAFGKDYVVWNYERTGNPVYLHIKQTKKLVPEDRPSKKPTLLAIGTLTTMLYALLRVISFNLSSSCLIEVQRHFYAFCILPFPNIIKVYAYKVA